MSIVVMLFLPMWVQPAVLCYNLYWRYYFSFWDQSFCHLNFAEILGQTKTCIHCTLKYKTHIYNCTNSLFIVHQDTFHQINKDHPWVANHTKYFIFGMNTKHTNPNLQWRWSFRCHRNHWDKGTNLDTHSNGGICHRELLLPTKTNFLQAHLLLPKQFNKIGVASLFKLYRSRSLDVVDMGSEVRGDTITASPNISNTTLPQLYSDYNQQHSASSAITCQKIYMWFTPKIYQILLVVHESRCTLIVPVIVFWWLTLQTYMNMFMYQLTLF